MPFLLLHDAVPAQFTLSPCICSSACPFICLSVCLTHVGVLPKWLGVGSRKQSDTVP